MVKLKDVRRVFVRVSFENASGKELAAGETCIDTDVKNLTTGKLVDACQRAVANSVETLNEHLTSTRDSR